MGVFSFGPARAEIHEPALVRCARKRRRRCVALRTLEFIQQRASSTFPIGTLIVNITGSLVLGFVLRYALGSPSVSAEIRALLTTGFCGGYTTFSTFSYDAMTLIEDGDYRRAAIYIGASVLVSLIATFLGIAAAGQCSRRDGRCRVRVPVQAEARHARLQG